MYNFCGFCSSPGYEVTLIAESTTGVFLAGELLFCKDGGETVLPEDLGQQAADLLFQEILSVCVLACTIIAFQDVAMNRGGLEDEVQTEKQDLKTTN